MQRGLAVQWVCTMQGSDCARPAMCCLRTLELVMVMTTMMRMMVLIVWP